MKCGAGEGWRSARTIVQEMKKVLQTVKQESNILQTIKRRKAKQIGHILGRNSLLKHGTEGKIEGRPEVTVT
jgi:hypothetical protein